MTIGILGYLKEYSKRPTLSYKDVAQHLGIPEDEAGEYIKKFAYLVVNTVSEPDFPTRVRNVLNKNTMEEDVLVTNEEIDRLRPSVESYLGYKLKTAQKTLKKPEMEDISNTTKKVSFIEDESNELPPEQPQRPPKEQQKKPYQLNDEPEPMFNEYGYGRDERNQEYARLSNSGRSELLKYALQKSPYVHRAKVDNFIALFETDERELMLHPEKLYRIMTKVFGPEAGDIAFNSFKAILKNFAQPEMGFGVDPYTMRGGGYEGQPVAAGPMSYYHAQGVIPTGVSPNDPIARRLIEEYEEKRREDHADRMMEKKMKRMLDMQMMNVLDPNKQAMMQQYQGQRFGQSPMTDQTQGLVQMGLMVPVQTQHPDGSVTTRYEPRNGMNGQPVDPIKSNIETVKMMAEIFSTLKGGAQGPESLMNTIMTKWAEQAFQPQPNTVDQFVSLKKVMDTVSPPMNPQFGMQAADLALRQKRLELDADFANRREDREENRMRFDREQSDRAEQRSHDQLKETMSGVKEIGGQLIPYVFPLLFKGALGGAGPAAGAAAGGNPLGALSGLLGPALKALQAGGLGGAGGGGPEDLDISSLLGGGGEGPPQYNTSPYGQQAPPPQYQQQPPPQQVYQQQQQQQPQQEPQQQVIIQQVPQQAQEVKTSYTPADFDKYDLHTLQELKAQGLGNEAAIDSFLSSINQVINKKAMSNRQQPQPQVIMQQESQPLQTSVVTPEDVQPPADQGVPVDEEDGSIG